MFVKIGWSVAVGAVSIVLAGAPALAQTTGAAPTTTGTSSGSGSSASSAYDFEVPAPLSPFCCGAPYYDHKHVGETGQQIMKNFNQKLAAVQLAIIEALRLATGQLSGNLREQTGAGHTLADQQDDRSTVKSVETVRMEAMRDSTSGTTSCRVITGSKGGGIESPVQKFRVELAKSFGEYERGLPGTPAAKGRNYALMARVDMHCSEYADPADVAAGICKTAGKLPGADLNVADSLFYTNDGKRMTLEEDRVEAAKAFLVHATTPEPPGALLANEAQTPQGKEKAARLAASYARNSVAYDTAADFLARRKPTDDQKLEEWGKDMASKMSGFQGMDFSKGISKNDWLSIYSRAFLLQADFIGNSDQSVVTATKDIKNMMAVQLYQNFENYLLMEKIAMNLAIQTSILVEQSRQ